MSLLILPAFLRTSFIALSVMLLASCAADSHHRAGMSALDKGDYATAINELKQAVDLAPKDVEFKKDWLQKRELATTTLLSKADAAINAGHLPEATDYYKTILKYERENARALKGLQDIARIGQANEEATEARKLLKQGDIAQASQWASRALENYPDQSEAKAVKREIELQQSKIIQATQSLSALYKKPINLEFRDASVKMVFEALSRTTGINFIFDREVKGDQRTTVFLKQTSLEDSIDVILTTNQLEKKILNATSVLIYPNTPAKVKEYQDLMVKAFYLANVDAKQAASMLKTVLKVKEVFVDDKYNMLILRENPEAIALAEKLIALHDLDEPEVMLEVAVLEVNRSRLLNLGVQFPDQLTVSPLGGTVTSSGSGTTGSGIRTFKLNDLRNLNGDTLGITVPTATLNFQKTDGDANLLANPSLRVRDREKAKIMIGDKVPVVTTTSTANGFVAENIQYLDVGLKLEVEPNMHLRDEIGLKIALEVSSLVSAIKTNNGSQAYQIGTRNYSSALRLKDGETQLLAGLISDDDRSSANRIPLLGDLPVLGRLFSSQSDNRRKTEIVMSITPHLIRNIQRKDPSSESFWSGTESTLRTKPLQLRPLDTSPAQNPVKTNPPSATPSEGGASPSTVNTSGLKFSWKGVPQVKVGESFTVELSIDSREPLRATPLQLGFNPDDVEVVAVREGNFFSKSGKSTFAHVIDKPSGRVSVGTSTSDAGGAKGAGTLMAVEFKAKKENPSAEIQLLAVTPIGSSQAIGKPETLAPLKINITR